MIITESIKEIFQPQQFYLKPWHKQLKGLSHKSVQLYKDIQNTINNCELPYTHCNSDNNFITIKSTKLKYFIQHIRVIPYGKNLDICHFISIEKEIEHIELSGKLSFKESILILDLMAWIKAVNLCVQEAIEKLEYTLI